MTNTTQIWTSNIDSLFLATDEAKSAINLIERKYGFGTVRTDLIISTFIDWCHNVGGESVELATRRGQAYINLQVNAF